jgi:GTPase SAR1 family protein
MSRWVSESEISAQLGYKILIAGLSEAGKTAVKRIFFLKQQTEDVNSLSATINYERMSLTVNDVPVTIVDLGGQKIFLKRFLSGFSPFVFSNVKVFIYLIDVANKTSRNNSIQYFTACLEKLQKFSPASKVFVFLHKNDLIRNSPNYESIHEQFKEQFQIESSHQLKFFRTTIFRPESVIDAFGRIFEISVPDLARSDFVEGRLIGEIEEHHEVAMTLVDKAEPMAVSSSPRLSYTEDDEDPATLEKLRFIMKQSIKTENDASQKPSVFLGSAASEESVSETTLVHSHSFLDELTATDPSSLLTKTPTESEPQPLQPTSPEVGHLIEFYRISVEEATELVNKNYNQIFEMAVSSGVPVPLVVDIFLKYLPFIEKSQGQEKFQAINNNRLLEVFSAILKGTLNEEDIVKCLVLASEKPTASIREIISSYLIPEVKVEPPKKPKEVIKKPVEMTPIDIPIEVESSEGFIALPNTQGMGFKIDLVEEGLNARISFLMQSTMGQKELIGNSMISVEATPDEILYLLAYENNLLGLGVFEDGLTSMTFAARLIHESLRQMKVGRKTSTLEVETKRTRSEAGIRTDVVEFIIPIEVETEGSDLVLPDSEHVTFSLAPASTGFMLNLTQRGFPIGQAHIVENITELQLGRLLKEAMQIPIDSDTSARFAGRIIKAKLQSMVHPEKPLHKPAPVTVEREEDKTSDKLKEYLSLLVDEGDTF